MNVSRRQLVLFRASVISRKFCSIVNMERDYNAAVAALNTLQSNFAAVDAIRKSGRSMNQQAIPEMLEWCRKIGYEPSAFDKLNPIHIAGTKGKGSTSAFISSILAQYLPSSVQSSPLLGNVGLFTSPHLRFVRERIQINNKPLDEPTFARYFFEIWDRLEKAATAVGTDPSAPGSKPMYFKYLNLMAFHAYLQENVDSAVIECGIGGEYDSTNIIVSPTTTAITSLGIDHIAILGSTLSEIAWHKAGIFKPNAVAFTAPQPEEAMKVLYERAAEKGVKLHVVERHPELEKITLGLSADFQKTNASLAIAVAAAHLRALGHNSIPDPTVNSSIPLPEEFKRGLEQVHWPGRCEIRQEQAISWYIDGGHTIDSISLAGRWFAEHMATSFLPSDVTPVQQQAPRILIFNQQTRDAVALTKALHGSLKSSLLPIVQSSEPSESYPFSPFTHALFTTNLTSTTGYAPDLVSINTNAADVDTLAVQRTLAETWKSIDPECDARVVRSIEEAVGVARNIAHDWAQRRTVVEGRSATDKSNGETGGAMCLVTGSLHLVGGFIDVLETGK